MPMCTDFSRRTPSCTWGKTKERIKEINKKNDGSAISQIERTQRGLRGRGRQADSNPNPNPGNSFQIDTITPWPRLCVRVLRTAKNRGIVWWDIKEHVSIPWSILMFYKMVLLELIPGGGKDPHAPRTFPSPSPIGLTWAPPPHWRVFQKVWFKT